MLGKRSAQYGLFEADHLYLDHVGRETLYGFWPPCGAGCFEMGIWPSATTPTTDGHGFCAATSMKLTSQVMLPLTQLREH